MTNLILSKGAFSVTIQVEEISDDYSNQIKAIVIGTTKQKQELGATDNKIIDLLKITHQMVVRGILISSTERNSLISIMKGAETFGGPATLTYVGYPNSPLDVYVEKIMIIEKAIDKNADGSTQKKYEVQITLLEGVST